MFGRGKTQTEQNLVVLPRLYSPPYLFWRKMVLSLTRPDFLTGANIVNWGDHVNSVPDLAASPPCLDSNKIKTEQNWADITSDSDNDEDELEILYIV